MRLMAPLLLLAVASGALGASLPYATLSFGAQRHDSALENYRWDGGLHAQRGIELGLGGDRWNVGVVQSHGGARQGTGLPGETEPLDVSLDYLGLRVHRRLFSLAGSRLHATAGMGRLAMRYEPSELQVDVGGGQLSTVRFSDIDEWQYEFGLGMRRKFAGPLALGLLVTHQSFSLDTAHRNGTDIEESRERFGSWSGQLSLHLGFGGL